MRPQDAPEPPQEKVEIKETGNAIKGMISYSNTELDDLIRLHYLVTTRKVTTILEFGVGKSTIVFDHALRINKTN